MIKIVLITGSTDGIGEQAAIDLAEMGAKINPHGRSQARAKPALQETRRKTVGFQ